CARWERFYYYGSYWYFDVW
nr:immunoglobulin heavy chain junction region [Mus musculus]NSM07307.1 immunoglobulin heavy chain junction region [Mus musculus]NSM07596.1 immunoglobulin heavy chain junction region [Mus musculus]